LNKFSFLFITVIFIISLTVLVDSLSGIDIQGDRLDTNIPASFDNSGDDVGGNPSEAEELGFFANIWQNVAQIPRAIAEFTGLTGLFNFFAVFFRILTFRVDGIPPLINTLIFAPIALGTIYVLSGLIRGGGV